MAEIFSLFVEARLILSTDNTLPRRLWYVRVLYYNVLLLILLYYRGTGKRWGGSTGQGASLSTDTAASLWKNATNAPIKEISPPPGPGDSIFGVV